MRWLSLAALTILLSGCALPPAITIASLVVDAASYASTGKTVADHGISMVVQKDCALLRILEGEVCLEPDPERTARELAARNLRFDYPEDIVAHRVARAPLDPADRFATSLAFATDPEIIPGSTGWASERWLEEVGYLADSMDPAG